MRPEYLLKLGMHIVGVVPYGVGAAHFGFGLLQLAINVPAMHKLIERGQVVEINQTQLPHAIIRNNDTVMILNQFYYIGIVVA
jgi:hypothetical protein